MGTVVAHLRKEWREQRWTLLAVAGAVLLLSVAGGWAFGFGAPDYGTFAAPAVAASVALVVLALTTELFCAEGRRDGFGFLRRVPGALRVSWAVKTAFYLFACAASLVWGCAAWTFAAVVWKGAAGRDEVLAALGKPDAAVLSAGIAVVGLWILLASTWIPRGAAAVGAALLLLAALAAPVWLALRATPSFVQAARLSWLVGAAAAAVVLPIVASAVGLLRGLRVSRSPWSAAWRGLSLVALVAAPAYAAGFVRLERWRDLRPDDADVGLVAQIGDGGRFAWVTASRWTGDGRRDVVERAFRIDLETGTATPLGPLGSLGYDGPTPWTWLSIDSLETRSLVGVYLPSGGPPTLAWYDAADGRCVKTLPLDVVTPDLLDRQRAQLRRRTVVRLPDGRPVWVRGRAFEHDREDGTVASVPIPGDLVLLQALACGAWYGYQIKAGRAVVVVPLADGGVRTVPWERPGRPGAGMRLTAGRYLLSASARRGASVPAGGRWRLIDTEAGTEVAAPGLSDLDEPLRILDEARVLVARPAGPAGDKELRVVSTRTGEVSEVALPDGAPAPITRASVAGRRADGSLVISFSGGPDGRPRGYALFRPETVVLHSWTPSRGDPAASETVVACPDADTAIVLEDARRLVRIRWGTGERTTLYPR